MARGLWPASQPAHQPLASPCWTEAPPKDGTGERHSSHISPSVTNRTQAGQSGWEEVVSEHSEQKQGSQCTQASPAGASPHPACGTYSDGGIRASSLGHPGHLDWAECPRPRFSPGSPGRQDLHPTSRHAAFFYPLGQWAGCAPQRLGRGAHWAPHAPPSRFSAPGSCSGPGLMEAHWCFTDRTPLLLRRSSWNQHVPSPLSASALGDPSRTRPPLPRAGHSQRTCSAFRTP